MPRKAQYDYFDAFARIGGYAEDEARMLLDIMSDFDPSKIHTQLDSMHEIENASDQVNHEVFTRIVTEFITPIDREDILDLTQELDSVVDRIESVLQHIYMLNIHTIPQEALNMAQVIVKSTDALHDALLEFPSYKKSKTIKASLVSVNTLEEDGDRLYIEGMHRLYNGSVGDPLEILAWTKMFDRLERSCDACEHAADVIETIIMKNT